MKDLWVTLSNSMQSALSEMQIMTAWESLAVLFAVAYLLLALRTSVWCWAAALISSGIYVVLCWQVSLLMESILNLYYMAMAIYGYWYWTQGGKTQSYVPITSWPFLAHIKLIAITGIVSLLVGQGMASFTQASFPYLDATISCFSLMNTYLVAKKVLENWLYWIIIDAAAIYLYFSKGLMLTSGLFMIYVILAMAGYYLWRIRLEAYQHYSGGVME